MNFLLVKNDTRYQKAFMPLADAFICHPLSQKESSILCHTRGADVPLAYTVSMIKVKLVEVWTTPKTMKEIN